MLLRVGRGLWLPADPALVDAGREADLAIGRARVAIVVLLAVNPATALVRHPDQAPPRSRSSSRFSSSRSRSPSAAGQTPLAHSVAWLRGGRARCLVRHLLPRAVFASPFTLISLTSRITFALYLLAIFATSLRSDGRVAIFAGVLAC